MFKFLVLGLLVIFAAEAKPNKGKVAAKKANKEAIQTQKNEPKQLAPFESDFVGVPVPETMATHVYIVEETQGRILLARQADVLMSPSSMTKILTAYAVLDMLRHNRRMNLDTIVTVSPNAHNQEGSKQFLAAGENISIRKLLEGLIIVSGNDSATALAEALSGSESVFAQQMTKLAKSIGANNTNVLNAAGLPHPEHLTTCRDLVTITRSFVEKFPEQYALHKVERLSHNNIEQSNRNPLLGWNTYPCDGVKTGHAEEAGYGVVGSCLSEPPSEKTSWRLYIVTNGLSSKAQRFQETRKLVAWAFQNFECIDFPFRVKIPARLAGETTATIGAEIRAVLPRGQKAKIEITRPSYVKEAQKAGSPVGVAKITCSAMKNPIEIPVVIMQDLPPAGFLRRAWEHFSLFFAKAPHTVTIESDLPVTQ